MEADLREPHRLLAHPEVVRHIDFDRPCALLQSGTMHHLADDENPGEIMRAYRDALPSGSYVAVCHFWDPAEESPEDSAFAKEMQQRLTGSTMGTGRFRTRAEIAAFLDGLETVDPGLVMLHEWWPEGPRIAPLTQMDKVFLSGVARKP
ncbi:MAG: SAM-dependent methyltransferase [Saccharopolyspora sp.]|uniref:SAM-dependent methyltransferase n=1 Tax=Saccharopolyspora sp. TaxID=33915 RepID=UPI0025E5215C|nr:SAM-dependent methyltransferase [Saccharopolyspora sp.]MBQ6644669.1 SAM-dependent methyltransferase [Saccharopolyspora sp.]